MFGDEVGGGKNIEKQGAVVSEIPCDENFEK